MNRTVWFLVVGLVLLAGRAAATSDPEITGDIAGWEICIQAICGSAIFVGTFDGDVNGQDADGFFSVSAHHESPLPAPGETAAITDGTWRLRAGGHRFAGTLTGELCNNGNNTFTVTATAVLTRGGTGLLFLVALLNHNTIPFTIIGTILQAPVVVPCV